MQTSLGKNYFQKANAKDQLRIRGFYHDIIGCELQEINSSLDIFVFPEGETYGVRYVDNLDELLPVEEFLKGTWMSITSNSRDELLSKIEEFGVEELTDHSDENNYFFQAPGGQVFVI